MNPKTKNDLTPGEWIGTILLWLFVGYLIFRDEVHSFIAWLGL